MTIMKRGSTYHLRKRVPRRYERVEERKSIWVSLHTDSLTTRATAPRWRSPRPSITTPASWVPRKRLRVGPRNSAR